MSSVNSLSCVCRAHKDHQDSLEKEEIEDHLYDAIHNDVIYHMLRYRDLQVLLVSKGQRETEERKALLVSKAPLGLLVAQGRLETMVHLDLQAKQVLQLKETPVNKDLLVPEEPLAPRLLLIDHQWM